MEKASIVNDRTGTYFSVPRETIKDTNGYDSFHVPTDSLVAAMDVLDDMDEKDEKMVAIIHGDDLVQEVRTVYCAIAEIGGDAVVLLKPLEHSVPEF